MTGIEELGLFWVLVSQATFLLVHFGIHRTLYFEKATLWSRIVSATIVWLACLFWPALFFLGC